MNSQCTTVSGIRCPTCGVTIYSRARHDMRDCPCNSTFIDGGFDYMRFGCESLGDVPREEWQAFLDSITVKIDLPLTRQEIYEDYAGNWNWLGMTHD